MIFPTHISKQAVELAHSRIITLDKAVGLGYNLMHSNAQKEEYLFALEQLQKPLITLSKVAENLRARKESSKVFQYQRNLALRDILSMLDSGKPLLPDNILDWPAFVSADKKRNYEVLNAKQQAESREREQAAARELEARRAEDRRAKLDELGLTEIFDGLKRKEAAR